MVCLSFPDFNQGIHWIHLGDPDRLGTVQVLRQHVFRFFRPTHLSTSVVSINSPVTQQKLLFSDLILVRPLTANEAFNVSNEKIKSKSLM